MGKKQSRYIIVYDDSEEAYLFDDEKAAIENIKTDLIKYSKKGTIAKLYDLKNIKYKEFSVDIKIKEK